MASFSKANLDSIVPDAVTQTLTSQVELGAQLWQDYKTEIMLGTAVAAGVTAAFALKGRGGSLRALARTYGRESGAAAPALGESADLARGKKAAEAMLKAVGSESGLSRYTLEVGGITRSYRVYVPEAYKAGEKSPVLFALDGVTLANRDGMPVINGINKVAERTGYIAIYPDRLPRYFGKLFGWNSQDAGLLNTTKRYDDLDFMRAIRQDVRRRFSTTDDGWKIIGFSDGASFGHKAAKQLPGIDGIVSVSGTTIGREPFAPVRALIIHGKDLDPVVPYEGGTGSLTGLLARFGHKKAVDSKPFMQATRYAEANGFKGTPEVTDSGSVIERVYRASGTATGHEVREYLIKKPFGGHTWPGRMTGEGTETSVSGRNGPLTPATVFDANEIIARFLREGRTIQRDLPAAG